MALQLILGPSGSGKSRLLCERVIREADRNRSDQYLVLVPEQYTLQAHRQLCTLSPRGGTLNIDVLSFSRLAVRIFEETGVRRKTLLRETGKSLLLRLIAAREEAGLPLLSGTVDRPGALSELKSILSEMDQYGITDQDLADMVTRCGDHPLLQEKLAQLKILRDRYRAFQAERGLQTAETIPQALCSRIPASRMLEGSHLYLDGYTGFTPAQLEILACLMEKAADMTLTLTLDPDTSPGGPISEDDLFLLSKRTIQALYRLAADKRTPILPPQILDRRGQTRYGRGGAIAHLEENLFRPGRRPPFRERTDQVHLLACSGPMEEAEAAAAQICALTRRKEQPIRFREIAVVAGDLATYSEYLRRAFGRAGIPFYVDQTLPVTLNPAFEFVRAAFSILETNFSYESMMAFFRTGFVFEEGTDLDLLENYLLAAGIRGHKAWKDPFTRPADGFPEESLPALEEIRQSFADRYEPFAQVARYSARPLADYAGALWNLLEAFRVQEKLYRLSVRRRDEGKLSEEQVYRQAAGCIALVLDEAVLLLGQEKVKRTHFLQILQAGFAEARIGTIPQGPDEVSIGDLTRSRLSDPKVVFFLGMNDKYVPRRKDGRGILTDLDRDTLAGWDFHLAPTAREDAQIQRFYLYLALTKPSDRLILSWSGTDSDGRALGPAAVIGQIKALLPEAPLQEGLPGGRLASLYQAGQIPSALAEELARSRTWSEQDRADRADSLRQLLQTALAENRAGTVRLLGQLAPASLPRLSEETARRLYGTVLEGSVSRLEQFASCPFRQYALGGLGLQERTRFEVRPIDIGILIHRGLELLAKQVAESRDYTWRDLPDEVCQTWAKAALREAALEKSGGKFEDSFRNRGQYRRLLAIFLRSAAVMKFQLAAGDFTPALFERRFDSRKDLPDLSLRFAGGGSMHLTGKIDRIDEALDEESGTLYAKVVDYKTGPVRFDLREVYAGTELQLPVYLDAALQLEEARHRGRKTVCAGILYQPVQDPILPADYADKGEEELDRIRLRKVRPNGLILADRHVLSLLSHRSDLLPLVAPASVNKDGSLSKRETSAADESQMKLLTTFARVKMTELGNRILEGEIAPSPLRRGNFDPCPTCQARAACPYRDRDPLMKARDLPDDPSDRILEFMRQQVKESRDREGDKRKKG